MLVAITILLTTGFVIGWRTHIELLHVAEAILLLIVFASGMIWVGTWIGMKVRSADAVQGVVFVDRVPDDVHEQRVRADRVDARGLAMVRLVEPDQRAWSAPCACCSATPPRR